MTMPIRVDYYTDPYCAWSWALEPSIEEVERLEAAGVAWHLRQKPLIPDLAGSGKSGEDIARAWEHVEALTGRELDAGRWRTDPPPSTMAAVRAAKVAARFGPEAERKFVRALRPMLMTQRRSAEDVETLLVAADLAGIEREAFSRALGDTTIEAAIAEDGRAAEAEGVKSTPALVIRNGEGDRVVIEGVRDADLIRRAIQVLRTDQAVADSERERITSSGFMPETKPADAGR
jgi:predicted DsbA family dithiol-disulfide isomerase